MRKQLYLHFAIGAVSLLLIDLVLTMPAEANVFTCRASAVRLDLPLALIIEPVVANPADNPCKTDSKSLLSLTSVLGVSADALAAKTKGAPAPVTAEGSVADVNLGLNLGLLQLFLARAGVLDAKAKVVSNGETCKLSSKLVRRQPERCGPDIHLANHPSGYPHPESIEHPDCHAPP